MPKGTKVERCYQKVRETKGAESAARICHHSTGQSLKTGKAPKRKRSRSGAIIGILLLALIASTASAGTTFVIPDSTSIKTLKTASFALTTTGTTVPAVSGKKIKVYALKFHAAGTITCNFRDGASTALEGSQVYSDGELYTESVTPPYSLFSTSTGTSLDLVTTGTGTASGRVSYWDDDSY